MHQTLVTRVAVAMALLSRAPHAAALTNWASPEGLATLEFQYARAAADPFNPAAIEPFMGSVTANLGHWQDVPSGRMAIARSRKLGALNTIKRRLDACLGYDSLARDVSRKVILAAAKADPAECTVGFSLASNLGDLRAVTSEAMQMPAQVSPANQEAYLVSMATRSLVEKGFALEAKWNALLKDLPSRKPLIDDVCPPAACDAFSHEQYDILREQQVKAVKAINLPSRTVAQAVDAFRRTSGELNATLYDRERSYHVSHGDTPLDHARWRAYQGEGVDAGITKYGSHLTQRPLPASYASDPQATLDRLSRRAVDELPPSFAATQERLNEDPLADVVSRGRPDWQNALGYRLTPRAAYTPGNTYEIKLEVDGDGTRVPIDAKSLLKARRAQMDLVAGKLRELATFRYHSLEDLGAHRDTAGAGDMLKKVILANPEAIGVALLNLPALTDALCHGLKDIASDRHAAELRQWALLGATLATAVGTGGFALAGYATAATVSGAALSAISGAQAVLSLREGLQTQELAEMQGSACYGARANSVSCESYRQNMNRAITAYAESGLAASGALPFLSSTARLARGSAALFSEQVARLPDVMTKLKAVGAGLERHLGPSATADLVATMASGSAEDVNALSEAVAGMSKAQRDRFARKLNEARVVRQCEI